MLDKNHYIDLVDGNFSGTNKTDLSNVFNSLNQSTSRDHLVIHFHGGLVGRASAHVSAKEIIHGIHEGDAYPLFMVWNSDLKSTLANSYDQIFKDEVFHSLLRRILRFVLGKATKNAVGTRSMKRKQLSSLMSIPTEYDEIENYIQQLELSDSIEDIESGDEDFILNELEFDELLIKAERDAAAVHSEEMKTRGIKGATYTSLIDEVIVNEIKAKYKTQTETDKNKARGAVSTAWVIAKYGFKIFKKVIKRLRNGRGHGIYTTIIEEILRTLFVDSIGAVVWSAMKQDTADAFQNPDAGGSQLIQEIKQWWTPNKKITLIGHSAGAIYVGQFLKHLQQHVPGAKSTVLLWAPACTFNFMYEHKQYFEQSVDRLIVYGLSDEIESNYWEVFGYKGSLLYIISGLLEPDEVDMPIVGMQRYYDGGSYTDTKIRYVIDHLIDQVVWSITPDDAPEGLECGARKHGDFEDCKTQKSMTFQLKNM